MNRKLAAAGIAVAVWGLTAPALAQTAEATSARLFVLTDIGNEPDDQMSLVRLLLYANVIDIEGIGATTSTWQKDKVRPDIVRDIVAAYGQVHPNLALHAGGWPSEAQLMARTSSGIAGYGLAALENAPVSAAARALVEAAARDDARPLWVALWGGANTLAQALVHAQQSLNTTEFDAMIARLRVYSISDQDDAGPWLRARYPGLFYIVTPSGPDGADYAQATWTGIAGDQFYRNGNGADFTTVSNAWLDRHIRAKGALSAYYPRHMFIMEGDTPSFLGLIPNGLQSGDQPDWGGWGGRYLKRTPRGETRPIWTQGGDSFLRVTSADTVNGVTSDQATIWRWREAFQHDFAARMDWTVKPYKAANHPPTLVVNGQAGDAPIRLNARTGAALELDAAASTDPDGQQLHYQWFVYGEAGFSGAAPAAAVRINRASARRTTVTVTARCSPAWLDLLPCPPRNSVHIILAVTDTGTPALTRYRRIIVDVTGD